MPENPKLCKKNWRISIKLSILISKVAETDRILKNLSGATYDELLSVSQKVRKELRAAIPGTEQYNAALEQNRRVTEAVARAQKICV